MVGFSPTDPWSFNEGNSHSHIFWHIEWRVPGHLGSQQRALCPSYVDSGLSSVAPSDTEVLGVLDKAGEDPQCGTHTLLPPSLYSLCLVQTWLGVLALFPWEQELDNLLFLEVPCFLHCCLWISKQFLKSPSLERESDLRTWLWEPSVPIHLSQPSCLFSPSAQHPCPGGLEMVYVLGRPCSQPLPSGSTVLSDKGVKPDKPLDSFDLG